MNAIWDLVAALISSAIFFGLGWMSCEMLRVEPLRERRSSTGAK